MPAPGGESTAPPQSGHPLDQQSLSPSQLSAERQISTLRQHLTPLLGAESSLADRLSGGVAVSGSGKGSVFVRSGWQARNFGLSFGLRRDRASSGGRFSFSGQRNSLDDTRRSYDSEAELGRPEIEQDKLVEDVAALLNACKNDIKELWELPIVRKMRDNRRLMLEEWAE
ncbi:hypothetical protein A0H81_07748 [Grifola frondosa]|uniref:Uncharacterized protein n=1 Tax=Grifola frondosa TaxID=5627 RepID=A0A1C7M5J2_GRIFR|nr:hypothetical protein A0H81_07748 [Grifola frondosa]